MFVLLCIEFVIVHSFSVCLGPVVRQDTNGPVALSSSIPVLDTTHYKGWQMSTLFLADTDPLAFVRSCIELAQRLFCMQTFQMQGSTEKTHDLTWTLLNLVDLIESRAHFQLEVDNADTPSSRFPHCCHLSFRRIFLPSYVHLHKIEATYMSTYYPMIKHNNHVQKNS